MRTVNRIETSPTPLSAAFDEAIAAERSAASVVEEEAAEGRLDKLVGIIEALPCDSLDVLRLKAKVAAWACEGEWGDVTNLGVAADILKALAGNDPIRA